MLSKISKGRYLDFKRASLASQKGVNWKPIYALLVCRLRILFTKTILLVNGKENLKGIIVWKAIVLLFSYLNLIQLLFLGYADFHFPCLQVTCYLVYSLPCQQKKRFSVTLSLYSALLLFLCYFVFILSCLNLTLSQSGLVILSTAKAVIIIMNFELWIMNSIIHGSDYLMSINEKKRRTMSCGQFLSFSVRSLIT